MAEREREEREEIKVGQFGNKEKEREGERRERRDAPHRKD